VGAFVLMGQIDGEGDGGDGVLFCLIAISDTKGEAQVADADPVDGDAAVVVLVLRVGKGSHRKRGEKNPTVTWRQQWERRFQRATEAAKIKASG